jgi:hypothetical protein
VNYVARIALLLSVAIAVAACAAPTPTPTPTPTAPSSVASPATTSPEAVQIIPGQFTVACDDRSAPGGCLNDVAFALANLPAGHPPVVAVTASFMDSPCPGASTCAPPPHRGDVWVVFTLQDGQRLEMWFVNVMGIRSVQRVGADMTPPASTDPATVSYPLMCGTIPAQTCAAVAQGGVVSITNPASVRVAPTDVAGQYRVTWSYADGSQLSADVERDPNSGIWSAVHPSATPTP